MTVDRSPISFMASVNRLPEKGLPVRIEADATQREALAAAHALLSVESLVADLLVTKWKRDGVRVAGRVEARIVQACVITLDPVEAAIDEPVEAVFVPEGSSIARPASRDGEILVDADGPDAPETFSGDRIDVGALAEEFFALAIEPYPRKAGLSTEEGLAEPASAPREESPFARLAGLRPKQ